MLTLEELVGQQIMIGVAGPQVTREMIRIFQLTHAAGLIVFRPNFKSADAFRKLLTELEEKLQRKLLVAVDHEGGRVIHLAEGITVFPDNWALGNTGKVDYARKQGEIEAGELRRLGIDVNLAPTLDVLTKNFSPNIGIRSYGRDPELVAKLGVARIQAMQKNNLSACAKHFPGLGAATLDPHLDLPVLGANWKEMEKIHLKPFLAAIKAGVHSIMSSHPVYPKLDASKVPVTFSKKIIGEFLRRDLKFKGVIFSDDLEMGALRGLCPIGESAVRAVAAGHDMVLLCHDPKAQREAYDALLKAYQTGRLLKTNLEASAQRIQLLMAKRSTRFEKELLKSNSPKIAAEIAQKGILSSPRKRGSTSMDSRFRGNDNLTILFPRLSSLSKKIFIEKEMLDEDKFLNKYFEKAQNQILSLDPTEQEQKQVLSLKKEGTIIFFCYDAHLSKGNRRILGWLQSRKNAAVVFLRDPYDEVFLKAKIPYVTAYGFRTVQIEAAVNEIEKILEHKST